MKRDITTIKISKEVVGELLKLKIHPRQAYEEVIVKLIGAYKKGKTTFRGVRDVGKKEITTIKISKKIVKELSLLKVHPRQAYEEVIVKLLDHYNKNGR